MSIGRVVFPLVLLVTMRAKLENMSFVAKQLPAGLGSTRINPDREFFEFDAQEAKSLLEISPGDDCTPENEFENVTEVEKRLAKRTMFR